MGGGGGVGRGGGGRGLFFFVVVNGFFSNSELNTKSFSCQKTEFGRIFSSTTFLNICEYFHIAY